MCKQTGISLNTRILYIYTSFYEIGRTNFLILLRVNCWRDLFIYCLSGLYIHQTLLPEFILTIYVHVYSKNAWNRCWYIRVGLRKHVLLKWGWGLKIRISWSTASDGAMDGNIIIIKDLVTQKWNVALCPLMKTLKGMQLQNPYPPPKKKAPHTCILVYTVLMI